MILALVALTSAQAAIFYTVEDASIGSLATKIIRNVLTDEYVQIVTDFGGKVEALRLSSRTTGTLRDVLLTDNGNETAITENKFWKGMLLIPWANRIAYGKYTFYNDTNDLPLNDPPRQNALHGFLDGKKLTVFNTDITDYYATLTLLYDFDGTDQGYPYTMRMLVSYSLSGAGMTISFDITNNMPQAPLPLTVGWHPYFACSIYQARVEFDPSTPWNLVELNANMDPTGMTHLDSTFDGSREIGGNATVPTFYDVEYKSVMPSRDAMLVSKIYDAATNQAVVLWQDSNFRLVHIFTGAKTFFGEDGIALEPMSGLAERLSKVADVPVAPDDSLTKFICGICNRKLLSAESFIRTAKASYAKNKASPSGSGTSDTMGSQAQITRKRTKDTSGPEASPHTNQCRPVAKRLTPERPGRRLTYPDLP
eukprot:Em0012g490a